MENLESEQSTSGTAASVLFRSRRSSDHAFFKGLSSASVLVDIGKLPEESHTAGTSYVLLDKDGVFHQYREYNENHKVVFEIGYHHESGMGSGDILHVHIHSIPGVDGHASAKKFKISPGHPIYEKYKYLFLGVK